MRRYRFGNRKLKGDVIEGQEGMIALFLVMLILGIVLATIMLPAPGEHEKMQAKLLAMTVASSIDALSVTYKGTVSMKLGEEWDIKITNKEVEFSHGDTKMKAKILGNAMPLELESVESIQIKKEPGNLVEVSSS